MINGALPFSRVFRLFPGILICANLFGSEPEDQRLLQEGIVRSPEGATVSEVGLVAPSVMALKLQDREVHPVPRTPYVPQEGDVLRPGRVETPAWTIEGIQIVPKEQRLRRSVNGEVQDYGIVFRPFPHFQPYLWTEQIHGEPLTLETIDNPRAYSLQSRSDPAFSNPVTPLAVHRKTKPNNSNDITNEKTLEHRLYLVWPTELQEGHTYTLSFPGLNTRTEAIPFTHNSRQIVSEAIHVNQIGYRPDDPFKRAFFSLWMGTGGGLDFAPEAFAIIDDTTGEIVFEGPVSGGFPASRPEGFRTARNFVQSDVHYFDFADFSRPGTYRLHVPGVGVSLPFTIGASDSWAAAFRTSMHGFLSHRSGIQLGAPLTSYERPRNMHPADGFKVFRLPVTMLEGEASNVEYAIRQKIASGEPWENWETFADGWGGYMDAGDYDRRSQHLNASRHLAELFALNPPFFEEFSLILPAEEANDNIPDLLNEVIWNVAFYRRLQADHGGVGGGIESTQHPRPGETSWQESLVIGVFAPDPFTSYSYAGAAALLARLLKPYDPTDAAEFARTAVMAWDWAEVNATQVLDEAEARTKARTVELDRLFRRDRAENFVREQRFIAAGELYALTGEARFHEAFQTMAKTATSEADELGAFFRYALLPDDKTDPSTLALARNRIIRAAEEAIRFGKNNAFGLHTHSPNLPMMGYVGFYSVPEMVTGPVLPRAYLLTGDQRYLEAALKAAHYSAGANPLNMTFTTGVGHRYPQNPLHIDSRVSGQPAPKGITIYGPMDASADFGFNNWVHTWHLQEMLPHSRTWPAAEWHVDLFRWPAMSEYTIHQTFRPTAYYWGFLAARPSLD